MIACTESTPDVGKDFGCIHHEEKPPELKPCPFCGGEAEVVGIPCGRPINSVRCKDCRATTGQFDYRIDARDNWNTRHEPYKERAERVLRDYRDYIEKNPDAFGGVGDAYCFTYIGDK